MAITTTTSEPVTTTSWPTTTTPYPTTTTTPYPTTTTTPSPVTRPGKAAAAAAATTTTTLSPVQRVAIVPATLVATTTTPAPTKPAMEGVDAVEQADADTHRATQEFVAQPHPVPNNDDPNEPNRYRSGVGGGGQTQTVAKAGTVLIQMTTNYASAQSILREGQVYNVSQEMADKLLACDPPACKVQIDPGVRQSRVTAPDPEQ